METQALRAKLTQSHSTLSGERVTETRSDPHTCALPQEASWHPEFAPINYSEWPEYFLSRVAL